MSSLNKARKADLLNLCDNLELVSQNLKIGDLIKSVTESMMNILLKFSLKLLSMKKKQKEDKK